MKWIEKTLKYSVSFCDSYVTFIYVILKSDSSVGISGQWLKDFKIINKVVLIYIV